MREGVDIAPWKVGGTGVGIDVMKVYGGGDLLSEANSPFGRALTPVQCIEYHN